MLFIYMSETMCALPLLVIRVRYEGKEASDMLTMGSASGQMCTKTRPLYRLF